MPATGVDVPAGGLAPLRHIELVSNAEIYNPLLLQAIAAVVRRKA